MLGIDGSDFARRAEEVLESWPIFEDADIDVTSVAAIPWASAWAIGAYVPPEAAVDEAKLGITEHGRMCDEALGRLRAAGRGASARVAQGDAATELIRAARKQSPTSSSSARTDAQESRGPFSERCTKRDAPCAVLGARGTQAQR